MKALVQGKVVHVESRDYVTKDGRPGSSTEVYLAASDPRWKPDRFSVDSSIAPTVDEDVAYLCLFKAQPGKFGPYLSVRGVERVSADKIHSLVTRPFLAKND